MVRAGNPGHWQLGEVAIWKGSSNWRRGLVTSPLSSLTGASHWPNPTVNQGKGPPGTKQGERGRGGIWHVRLEFSNMPPNDHFVQSPANMFAVSDLKLSVTPKVPQWCQIDY